MATLEMATNRFDPQIIRERFPILASEVNGRPLAYLDNAATTQKPDRVIEAVARFWRSSNGPVSRGVHELGARATSALDDARRSVARFLAAEPGEIVFVRGVTEAVNLVARALGETALKPGDEVVVTALEHHSNFLPWRQACERGGATLRVAPIRAEEGNIDLEALDRLLSPPVKILAIAHVSNVLGSLTPLREAVALARDRGVITVVDGAQAACHMAIDVREIGCDFYAISAHKMFGPAGIGALYGRADRLAALPPVQFGGGMVELASMQRAEWLEPPERFEPGTPNVEGAVGMAEAIAFIRSLDADAVRAHEDSLHRHAREELGRIEGVRMLGAGHGAPLVSFCLDGAHPHDVATVLDAEGVAVRAGTLCAQPLLARLGLTAVTRASFACYNTHEEVERLVAGVKAARRMLA